jgi:prevent-host-death family protein
MTEVAIEALNARLADYVSRAQQGERILITEHGHSVALLIPAEGSEPTQRAWKLVETGVASWSGGKPEGTRQKPRSRGKSASDIVLEDRR